MWLVESCLGSTEARTADAPRHTDWLPLACLGCSFFAQTCQLQFFGSQREARRSRGIGPSTPHTVPPDLSTAPSVGLAVGPQREGVEQRRPIWEGGDADDGSRAQRHIEELLVMMKQTTRTGSCVGNSRWRRPPGARKRVVRPPPLSRFRPRGRPAPTERRPQLGIPGGGCLRRHVCWP